MSRDEVLRELDSYRSAIRAAFEEGFAMGRVDSNIRLASERSEARQTEALFAFTRMAVGDVARAAAPEAL